MPPPREIAAPPMRFHAAARGGDIVARAEALTKGFDGRPLFSNVSFDILRGQRWAVLGPNGCGKTTLLGCLLGLMPPDDGQASVAAGVTVGYFDQQLADFDENLPLVDAVRPKRKQLGEQQRRDLLARFGLTGETALQTVGSLSGGQRCRAALARLAAAEANFLVLDEPTNHLDLWAREALEKALLKFDGTVLFVSHDRYFVNRVADHLLVIEPGRVRIVEGNYDSLSDVDCGQCHRSRGRQRRRANPPRAENGRAKPPLESAASPTAKRPSWKGRSPNWRRAWANYSAN